MTRTQGWSVHTVGLAVALLAAHGSEGFGQPPVQVIPSATNATPNPALMQEQVSSSLSATVMNPPTAPYGCQVGSPTWAWFILSVQLNGGTVQTGYNLTLNSSTTSPNATLTGTFTSAGSWSVNMKVTVQYTDSPCSDTWGDQRTITVPVTVLDVEVMPNPVVVPLNQTTQATVTTYPAGFESGVTMSAEDPSIAQVSGSSPDFTITGLSVGSTNLVCYYQGRRCPVTFPCYVYQANLNMSVAAGQKLDPGAFVPLNANNDNGSTVANGIPAVRDKDTSPIPNEKDLVKTVLQVDGLPNGFPVTYTLSVNKVQNAHGDISVWNTQTKQFQFTLPIIQNGTAGVFPNF
jgi:hypothetical protein